MPNTDVLFIAFGLAKSLVVLEHGLLIGRDMLLGKNPARIQAEAVDIKRFSWVSL